MNSPCAGKNGRLTITLQPFQSRTNLEAAHVNFKLILVKPLGRFHDLPLRAASRPTVSHNRQTRIRFP